MSKYSGSLPRGKEFRLINETTTGAGSTAESIGIDSDSVLVSLFVEDISGTLDVVVYTDADDGQSLPIITFPVLTAATSNLLIRKAAVSMDRIRVVATYSGVSTYSVRVRGIGSGEASVTIKSQTSAVATQKNIGAATELLIGSNLDDRAGLILKNNSASSILYIGYTLAEATLANGYPIGPGESMGIDIAAGQSIYGVSSSGTIDVRLMEAGGLG